MSRTIIVVLGMHRSGTSALTGVLGCLGANAGVNLIPADQDSNPRGFWENAEISAINEQILEQFETAWDDVSPLPESWWRGSAVEGFRNKLRMELRQEFSKHALSIIKDPRLCRLVPFWSDLLRSEGYEPAYVHCLRHPAEVAMSLLRRDGISAPESCLLWLSYNLDAERSTRNQRRVFVTYDELLSDWNHVVDDIGALVSVAWQQSPCNAAERVKSFLDPALRHYADRRELSSHPACQLAERAYALLGGNNTDYEGLDLLNQDVAQLVQLIVPWSSSASGMRNKERSLAQVELEKVSLQQEINRLKGSVSWRITAPVRAAYNGYRKLIGNKRG